MDLRTSFYCYYYCSLARPFFFLPRVSKPHNNKTRSDAQEKADSDKSQCRGEHTVIFHTVRIQPRRFLRSPVILGAIIIFQSYIIGVGVKSMKKSTQETKTKNKVSNTSKQTHYPFKCSSWSIEPLPLLSPSWEEASFSAERTRIGQGRNQ